MLVVDGEAVDPLVEAFAPLQLQGAAAQEVDGAFQFAGKDQSGFQRIVVHLQVHVPVAGAFLDAQRVDGLVSSVGRATLLSYFHQRPVDGHRFIFSAVQLLICASARISYGGRRGGDKRVDAADVPITPMKETRRARTRRPPTSICRWVENGNCSLLNDVPGLVRTVWLQRNQQTTRFTCRTLTCEGPEATAATSGGSGPSTARRSVDPRSPVAVHDWYVEPPPAAM